MGNGGRRRNARLGFGLGCRIGLGVGLEVGLGPGFKSGLESGVELGLGLGVRVSSRAKSGGYVFVTFRFGHVSHINPSRHRTPRRRARGVWAPVGSNADGVTILQRERLDGHRVLLVQVDEQHLSRLGLGLELSHRILLVQVDEQHLSTSAAERVTQRLGRSGSSGHQCRHQFISTARAQRLGLSPR